MSTATIISDASHCHWSKTGGWAGWAKADGKASQTWSGNFKSAVQSSVEAELFAIANVLFSATTSGYLPDYSDVLIQSDCTWPLTAIMKALPETKERRHPDGAELFPLGRKAKISTKAEDALILIMSLVRCHNLTIAVRHVKGHREGGGRQWVNREVDKAARHAMRASRNQKQQARKADE